MCYNTSMIEKNQAHKELLEQVDKSSGSFIITDKTGKVVYANKKIEERTGYSVAEAVGKRPGELWGGNMGRDFYGRLWFTIRDAREPFISQLQNTKKSGEIQEDFLHIAPIKNENDQPDYFVEIQPDSNMNINQFVSEFRVSFSGVSITTQEFCGFLSRWLNILSNTSQRTEIEYSSASSFLKKIFVQPLLEKFASREDDAQLVLLAQQDPRQFKHIYNKYYDAIYNYFVGHLGRIPIAEDLAQDTFYKALKYLPMFTISNASYKTYLLRMAHNALVNFYRKKKTISINEEIVELLQTQPEYEDHLVADALWNSMTHLSENEYRAIVMKYKEDLSVREIAVVLGKTENAVKLYLSRGREKIRGETMN